MRRWLAGDLMSISAGLAVILAAFLPFASIAGDQFYGLQLHMYTPIVYALVDGLALVASGWSRTLWAGLTGLASAFVVGVVVLMVHEGVYQGMLSFGVPLPGDASHITGIAEYVFFAAGTLAAAAGIVVVVQREPPVRTKPAKALPDQGFTLP